MFRYLRAYIFIGMVPYCLSSASAYETLVETDGVLPPPLAEIQTQPIKIAAKQDEILGIVSLSLGKTEILPDAASKSVNQKGFLGLVTLLADIMTPRGMKIFNSVPEIIFAIAVGGFFGNLSRRWLIMIIITLTTVLMISTLLNYTVDSDTRHNEMITDILKNGR